MHGAVSMRSAPSGLQTLNQRIAENALRVFFTVYLAFIGKVFQIRKRHGNASYAHAELQLIERPMGALCGGGDFFCRCGSQLIHDFHSLGQRLFELANHVFVERIDMICSVERFMVGHEYRFEAHHFEAGECVQKMVEQMVVTTELNKGGRGVYHVVATEQYLFSCVAKAQVLGRMTRCFDCGNNPIANRNGIAIVKDGGVRRRGLLYLHDVQQRVAKFLPASIQCFRPSDYACVIAAKLFVYLRQGAMVYCASSLLQKIGEVANMVGVKMGYSNIGIAPGYFGSLKHGVEVLCSGELGVTEVNEQALLSAFKKQIPINAIGEVEVLDVENRMHKPRYWFVQRNHFIRYITEHVVKTAFVCG